MPRLLLLVGIGAFFAAAFTMFWFFPPLTDALVDLVGLWAAASMVTTSVSFLVATYRGASMFHLSLQLVGLIILVSSLSFLQVIFGLRYPGSLGLFLVPYIPSFHFVISFAGVALGCVLASGMFLRDWKMIFKWSGKGLFTALMLVLKSPFRSPRSGKKKKKELEIVPEKIPVEKVERTVANVRRKGGDVPFWHSDISHDLPGVELLQEVKSVNTNKTKHVDQQKKMLFQALKDFGIEVVNITAQVGPVVTLYRVEPRAGIKSSQIISLANDLARSMSAISARAAVIQGSNTVGIELPNDKRQLVLFRELVEKNEFQNSSGIPIALGKDISGNPAYQDLTAMPHLLVGGSTGSGKSVCMHTMMLSFLYKFQARECGLILVDPKRLEFMPYAKLPHLITPVVTEPDRALKSLQWLAKEMETRYKFMSELGVRNIASYNATGGVFMPFIIVMIDELADLVLVGGKDLEICLQRMAQMGRAAGIHLITATQRPSVDVLGGSIKVNFNGRIAFRMASKIDSRTILDASGAEQLLGKGDMLCSVNQKLDRYHGAFVSEEEIGKITEFLSQFGNLKYDPVGNFETSSYSNANSEDDLYEEAIALVRELDKCSTSLVQRHLKIGYNRAARLVEEMEGNGVITPPSHSGKRTVIK